MKQQRKFFTAITYIATFLVAWVLSQLVVSIALFVLATQGLLNNVLGNILVFTMVGVPVLLAAGFTARRQIRAKFARRLSESQ